MSIKSMFIGRPRAEVLARMLKAKGFKVTRADCYGYAINIAKHVGGSADAKEVLRVIEETFPGDRRDVHRTGL